MNKLLATLLATAAGATIAAAPAFAQNDTAGYQKAMDKIAADHKVAKQKCDALKDEDVCEEQADVMRARAELAAVKKHNNTADNRNAAQRKLAEAEYELAEEKCDTMKGNAKDSCMTTAKSARTAALGDTRARDTMTDTGATRAAAAGSAGLIASTDTKDPVKAAAVAKCDERGNKTACLVENKDVAATTMGHAGDKTRAAADRTENAAERAGSRTATALSDTAITTKIKAGLAAAPDLSALAIKVETEKGVVMLSGFVDSKAEADRAEKLAKGVEGVTTVKSNIKVK
ncbi:BON domain-containing protein [Massilia yuzhufengensis]|uniref:Osmotically-inducible protein Y n=1 Tax=Massilia yuzhufengensis TaxID=1164594 RepID=A0A1I1I301_9BURK|nr:BON domain-containing protein [Massilia yuzhufengensis]SFC30172.1 BON domain-containing protein [Massilia yuzhufengensis]